MVSTLLSNQGKLVIIKTKLTIYIAAGSGRIFLCHVPNWTITRYEVELDEKIGIGFFSDVYKGQWHGHTVAIKVLAETTPRKLFVHEIGIWKKLDHPNVLELLGASSATFDPPWFRE